MKRVVVTGLGIISSIGNNKKAVTDALRNGKSGIQYNAEYAKYGLRSHVYGPIQVDTDKLIDKKLKRFMGDAAVFAYLAMKEAVEDAGLSAEQISSPSVGLITGSGAGSNENMVNAANILRTKGARKIGPTLVPRVMASTTSACLSVAYKIKGVSYSISSACATSAHCIGNAYQLLQTGKQNIIFAGGGDEVHWTNTCIFDSTGALSSSHNNNPTHASCPYDVTRDGFVISGGGGILVLEELNHALQRNAHIYAEVVGYGATSDGYDMVKPSGEGAIRCMQQALSTIDSNSNVDYINAHATSTLLGDIIELSAIKTVFGNKISAISSTKSLTGHALGAAGVNEAIYSLLMMENKFLSASANISELDKEAADMPIVTQRQDNVDLKIAMSNSFGFGGTNASLVFQKID